MTEKEYAVKVTQLVKIYDRTTRALDGLDLEIEPGTIFALLGPNGSGKTTLMRILTTQIRPTDGKAFVFGLNVLSDGDKIRKLVSYVPQEMSVWSDITGYENLLIYAKIYGIPSSERKKVITDALEDMGLTEFAHKLVKTYSGGMIRRLELACAILVKPKILFLDEPTIGLDPSARKSIWEKLLTFKKEFGATVFFNTHYMDEADLYSDKISIINRGKIVISGIAETLKRSIGRDTIFISTSNAIIDHGILSALKSIMHVSDVVIHDQDIEIFSQEADSALPAAIEILKAKNIVLSKISVVKPSLDDVFLKYAGARFESDRGIIEAKQVRDRIQRG